MARRPRAAQTKTRLWEITAERAGVGTNSLDVVRVFRERYTNISDQERDDLIDLGLMTLAGRVVISSKPDDGQLDAFSKNGYSDFVPVRIKNGNKFEIVRKQGRNITPREYFDNAPAPASADKGPRKLSRHQKFHAAMVEMRDKGILDSTLPEYLQQGQGH